MKEGRDEEGRKEEREEGRKKRRKERREEWRDGQAGKETSTKNKI
jgi:hypothetical protein